MLNTLFILIYLLLDIPISPTDLFWIFNTWLFVIGFVSQLIILYLIFTEPGVFAFIENEVRKIYHKSMKSQEEKITYYLIIMFDFIQLFLYLYFELYNVFIAYSLFTGTFYLIRHFLFLNEKS